MPDYERTTAETTLERLPADLRTRSWSASSPLS
jgi:hypothetical protein